MDTFLISAVISYFLNTVSISTKAFLGKNYSLMKMHEIFLISVTSAQFFQFKNYSHSLANLIFCSPGEKKIDFRIMSFLSTNSKFSIFFLFEFHFYAQ